VKRALAGPAHCPWGVASCLLSVACSILLAARQSAAAPFPSPETLSTTLARLGAADLVLFDAQRSGGATRVLLLTRAQAPAARVRALLMEPAAYRRAVPSFRRADVVARRGGRELQISWELEVPLWNLEGKLWLRPAAEGVDLELAEGDMAPGLFAVRVRDADGGALLSIDARANVREANWLTRRLAARSPLSEPAMTAAAAWVLLRAMVLEAERGATVDPRRYPRAAPAPPALATLDPSALARTAEALLGGSLVGATVRTRSDGRLERVEVAVPVASAPADVWRTLADPQRWRALPGWSEVKVLATGGRGGRTATWDVDSQLPFVDFSALWSVHLGPALRAVAIGGDGRGAILGWDVWHRPGRGGAIAVFSLHPRLEKAGYIPRKFIEAEPLLEQGLSLALAYVDAVSLVRAIPGARPVQGAQ
jgi:hypothetical protein